MIIGSATRYIGGRGAVQTVYWRISGKSEKLVKIGKHFNLQKPTTEECEGLRSLYDSKTAKSKISLNLI